MRYSAGVYQFLITQLLFVSLVLESCSNPTSNIPSQKKLPYKESEEETIRHSLIKARQGLDVKLSFQTALLNQLPPGCELGKAYSEGNCFFDALAQWVNKINHTDVNTDKYLRMLCHGFYLKNKALVDGWNQKDYGGIDKGREDYYMVQYTAEECERELNGRSPIWGRPWVEGRILCKELQLNGICIIEILINPETRKPVVSYHLVDQEGYKSSISEERGQALIQEGNIPVLVNVQEKLHFVPLWKKEEGLKDQRKLKKDEVIQLDKKAERLEDIGLEEGYSRDKGKEKVKDKEKEEVKGQTKEAKIQALIQRAGKGDKEAQFELGQKYYVKWTRDKKDEYYQEARGHLTRARDRNYPSASDLLNKLHNERAKEKKEIDQADNKHVENFQHLLAIATNGDSETQLHLGKTVLVDETGLKIKNLKKAVKIERRHVRTAVAADLLCSGTDDLNKSEQEYLISTPEDIIQPIGEEIIRLTNAKIDVKEQVLFELSSIIPADLLKPSSLYPPILGNAWRYLLQNLANPENNPENLIAGEELMQELTNNPCLQISDSHPTLNRLVEKLVYIRSYHQQLVEALKTTLDHTSLIQSFQKGFASLIDYYTKYQQDVIVAANNNQKRIDLEELLVYKVSMSSEVFAYPFYRISRQIALHLLYLTEMGFYAHEKKSGQNHHVSCMHDVGKDSEPWSMSDHQFWKKAKQLYFKNNGDPALQPSREMMVYQLYDLLDIPLPKTALITLDKLQLSSGKIGCPMLFNQGHNKVPFFLQVSWGIEGQTAEDIFRNQDIRLQELDEKAYAKQVLGVLLTCPSDGKCGNFIFATHAKAPKLSYTLISIDNDEVFASPVEMTSNDKYRIHLKCVLLALPQMENSIPESVQKYFLKLSPALLVLDWLDRLRRYNILYEALNQRLAYARRIEIEQVGKRIKRLRKDIEKLEKELKILKIARNTKNSTIDDEIKEINKTIENKREHINKRRNDIVRNENYITKLINMLNAEFSLPIKLNYDEVIDLQQRLKLIQRQLKANSKSSLMELLKVVYPSVGAYYEEKIADLKDPYKVIAAAYRRIVDDVTREYRPPSKEERDCNLIFNPSEQELPTSEQGIRISPKQAMQELIATTDLQDYEPHQQLIWIERVAQVNIWPDTLHASWYDPLLLIRMVKEGASEQVMKALIEKAGADIRTRDETGQTTLHAAVGRGSEEGLKQISMLVGLGVDIEAQENQTLVTPLDIAAEQKDMAIFKLLIELGAGKKSKHIKINRFYQGLKEEEKEQLAPYITKLTQINPKVGWKISLDDIFPYQGQGKATLKTVTKGDRVISEKDWDQLFEADGTPKKTNTYGVRSVPFVEKNGQRIYVKFYPQFPGTELAVIQLAENLLGYCAPYGELASIEEFPVLLIQGVPGETLNEVLESENYQERLSKLDAESVSKALILAMLINPGDGNLGNYILSPFKNEQGEERYRLICIDNDQAFMPAIAKIIRTGELWPPIVLSLRVKAVLYCLDAMKAKVSQVVADKVKRLDLIKKLDKWLSKMKKHHKKAVIHFNKLLIGKSREEKKTYIGVTFPANMIEHLFNKLMGLQMALNQKEIPNHLDLLEILERDVCKRYKPILNNISLDVKEKFAKVENITKEQDFTSSSNGLSFIAASRGIPILDKASLEEELWSCKYGPEEALKDLQKIKEQHTKPQQNLKDMPASLLEKKLQEMDLNQLSPPQQKAVLEAIKGKELSYVYLKNHSLMTRSILASCKLNRIKELDLSGCINLKAIYTSFLRGPLIMPSLTYLNLDESGIDIIKLQAKQLTILSACKCIKLQNIELIAPQLERLYLREAESLNVEEIKKLFQQFSFSNTFIYLTPTASLSEEEYSDFLCRCYLTCKDKGKDKLAVHYLKRIIKQGNGVRTYNLKFNYQNYREVMDQGHPIAQYNLGVMYQNGWVVNYDYQEAVKWYRRAADQEYGPAQYVLGFLCQHGKGIKQDHQEAVKWYQKAAVQGYVPAQYILGFMYKNGHGVAKNYEEAFKWYQKAAEQGEAVAQYNLGIMYQNGWGIPQDYQEAKEYYKKVGENATAHIHMLNTQWAFGVMDFYRTKEKYESKKRLRLLKMQKISLKVKQQKLRAWEGLLRAKQEELRAWENLLSEQKEGLRVKEELLQSEEGLLRTMQERLRAEKDLLKKGQEGLILRLGEALLEAEGERPRLQQEIQKLQEEIESLQGEIQKLQEGIESLQGEIQKLQEGIESLQGEIQKLQERIESLQGEIQKLQERIESLQGEIQHLEKRSLRLKEKILRLKEEIQEKMEKKEQKRRKKRLRAYLKSLES